MAFQRLAIVGTGPMGASVGLAAKRAGTGGLTGFDIDAATLATAAERGGVLVSPILDES